MKTLGKLMMSGAVIFAVLQTVRPSIPTQPVIAEVQAPAEIRHILNQSCYSCHSNDRRLAWFDEIVPGYWLVRHDILTAREHLNFSTLGSHAAAAQRATLFEAVNMIQLGAMPLPQFTRLHSGAKITPEELKMLKDYLAPWAPLAPPSDNLPAATSAPPAITTLDQVKPEWNGVAFDPSIKSWELLSTTDRGDNNTFRFILGNNIAVKAVQSGKIAPWPDGARLAKIAWQQELGGDGLVHPGKFIQVELMVKDARAYKATEGWGWGRWRGPDLKPFGNDAGFVNECTACHSPVHGNDFVYTLPITQSSLPGEEVVNNHAAELPASLPYQPLHWIALTMYVDRSAHTTATLYGNDDAVQFVRSRNFGAVEILPPGAVLALVSWQQRDDPHWFGARIPNRPITVEFVQPAASGATNEYISFSGAGLGKDRRDAIAGVQRMNFLLGLTPVSLPRWSTVADKGRMSMNIDDSNGLITRRSQHSVDQTVAALRAILDAKGITLFALIDHSGEAAKVRRTMPPTKLLIFGDPKAGTPLMQASPNSAIDLPFKVLVRQAQDGTVITYNSTDRVRVFKPDPRTYNMGLEALKLSREEIAYVAFAGWNAVGAKAFGYPAYWTTDSTFQQKEFDLSPDETRTDLTDLPRFIVDLSKGKKI